MELHQMTKIEERELWSIAAFRLRESANRILALADRAESALMRRKLLSICAKLAEEEQQLLVFAREEGREVADDHSARVPAGLRAANGRAADESPDRPPRTSQLRSKSKLKSWQS